LAVAEIFSGEIDFESDLQPGDNFDILVEKTSHDGQFSGYGAVLAARFVTDGRDLRISGLHDRAAKVYHVNRLADVLPQR